MQIYHYTSIKSLALILQSKKIRFTRLDLVDDIKEVEGIPERFKSHIYISCWTYKSEENISLWSLYTQMKGVRIQFPKTFYNLYNIKEGDNGNWGFYKDTICPLNIEELRTDKYIINNPFWLSDGFCVKVKYTSDYVIEKKKNISTTNDGTTIHHVKNLLMYKDSIWGFQNELRFYLNAIPLPPLDLYHGNKKEQMLNIGAMELQNEDEYIDIRIKEEVLNNITVRLHPNCEFADKLIVGSLIKEYTASGQVENSSLNGIVRK